MTATHLTSASTFTQWLESDAGNKKGKILLLWWNQCPHCITLMPHYVRLVHAESKSFQFATLEHNVFMTFGAEADNFLPPMLTKAAREAHGIAYPQILYWPADSPRSPRVLQFQKYDTNALRQAIIRQLNERSGGTKTYIHPSKQARKATWIAVKSFSKMPSLLKLA